MANETRRRLVAAKQIHSAEAAVAIVCPVRTIALPNRDNGVWKIEHKEPTSEMPTVKMAKFSRGQEIAKNHQGRACGLLARLEKDGTISLAVFQTDQTLIFSGLERQTVVLRAADGSVVEI